jgi:hypothetical protein
MARPLASAPARCTLRRTSSFREASSQLPLRPRTEASPVGLVPSLQNTTTIVPAGMREKTAAMSVLRMTTQPHDSRLAPARCQSLIQP